MTLYAFTFASMAYLLDENGKLAPCDTYIHDSGVMDLPDDPDQKKPFCKKFISENHPKAVRWRMLFVPVNEADIVKRHYGIRDYWNEIKIDTAMSI